MRTNVFSGQANFKKSKFPDDFGLPGKTPGDSECMDVLKNLICPPRPAAVCALRIKSRVRVCISCRDRLGWWWVVERAESPLPRLCRRGGTEPWEGACMEQSLLASPDGFCSLGGSLRAVLTSLLELSGSALGAAGTVETSRLTTAWGQSPRASNSF